ncbi:MAG: peptide chain release factor N(5)-glutamine methyltransferase, partial [Parcubacteria group bacterium]
TQNAKLGSFLKRRMKHEPIAYITGHKEFYGLDFEVNKHTLIPRPETELIVDLVLKQATSDKGQENTGITKKNKKLSDTRYAICDIGTGSGNIIVSIAKRLESKNNNHELYGIDVSRMALKIARKNSKRHNVARNIKFIHGSLLSPLTEKLTKLKLDKLIIAANLPYLSKKIYASSPKDVSKYEPGSSLYSENYGLAHYEKLLKQISERFAICDLRFAIFFEISPEQKNKLEKIIKNYFPKAKVKFYKDLAGKRRVCKITI